MRNLEPGNSSTDQCHAHDIYKLTSSHGKKKQAHDRSHHPPDSQHIPLHSRRNPHKRLDGSKNCVALLHNVVPPTKNFVFDSHWQQSHSIRWKYISERSCLVESIRYRHPQNWCVVDDGAMMGAGRIHTLLPKAMPPAMERR
jgi:hypothetical protein